MKFIYIILFITTLASYSQDANSIGKDALIELQNKNFNGAAKLFDSAYTISGNHDYLYEKAYVSYKRKDFKSTIKILESFIHDVEAKDRYYQLLGSSYDFIGEKDKALNVIRMGITKIPNSSRLYYELGVTEYGRSNTQEAISYWDLGVKLDPTYSNNYFQLMKETYQSDRKVYSMIFAEIFLNLPDDDLKKKEASSIVYNVYKTSLELNNTKAEPDFTEYIGEYDPSKAAEYPFRTAFQQIANKVYKPTLKIGFNEIIKFRTDFINLWFENGYNELFPNPLFEYHKLMIDEGFFETYSYMTLSSGNLDEFKIWMFENRSKFTEFINWQYQYPIDLKTFIFNSSAYIEN
ncbi:tetratricopeptide repeat protein [Candidatus Kapabacteria bacterium]|nr:tetratricopeptide repeat protein [Candidatus Kapabacteria bacterium]